MVGLGIQPGRGGTMENEEKDLPREPYGIHAPGGRADLADLENAHAFVCTVTERCPHRFW